MVRALLQAPEEERQVGRTLTPARMREEARGSGKSPDAEITRIRAKYQAGNMLSGFFLEAIGKSRQIPIIMNTNPDLHAILKIS